MTRDVNALEQAGLIIRAGNAIRARYEALFAFLPIRKVDRPPIADREILDSLAAASIPNAPR